MVYDQQSKSSSWTPTPRKSSFFPPAHIQTKTEAKKGSELVGKLPSKAQRDKIRRSLFGDIPEMTGAKAETAPTEAKDVQNPTQVSEEATSGEIQRKAETGLSQSQGYGVPSREVRNKIRRRMFGNLEPTPVQKHEEGTSPPTPLLQGEGRMDDAGGEEKGLAETEISLPIQAKLTIGEPNDKYEQEADRVARQVVDKIHSPTPETVQREEMGDEDEVRLKSDAGSGGKQEAGVGVTGVRKSPIQRLTINRAVNSEGETQEASADLEASIQGKRGSGQPLDESVREPMEGAFGADFSGVRVHTDGKSDELNQAIQAKAFTTGEDVFFRQGAYEPGSKGGQELLAHELTHVVQQSGGAVQRNGGVPVNDDESLEQEADVKSTLAASRGKQDNSSLRQLVTPQQAIVQGKWFRMSTLLDSQDEVEVAEIQQLANDDSFFKAFSKIVSKHEKLANDFQAITTRSNNNEDIREAAFNILWETFEEPSKAYTAAEVMELLEESEIISQESDVLIETDNEDDDIESLIAQFSNLSISVPFRSDIDDQKEEHQVFWDTNDISVRSNPKPLKDIITQKSWEGYKITTPALLTQLDQLRKTAKLALYKISGNAKRNIVGARTKGNMNAFRNALEAIAKVLSNLGGKTHAATLMPPTVLSYSANYPMNSSPIEGTHVKAIPLSIRANTSGSSPVDGRLMKSIRHLAGSQSKSYVQMHLLNDLVFGPGQLWNLTPGPKQSNVDMEKNVEDPLKRAILGKGLVINFEAKVNYSNDPITATNNQIAQNPDKYRFQSIDFKAEQLEYDQTTKSWVVAVVQDPDVAKVNGERINWRYGSLMPLVPKPRIFDPNTTLQDLTSANIQSAAAKRIIAFVQANPTWRPTGKGKQQQLAKAVKAFDGGKTIPNISSWKAISVLWT
ncbi:MAG: DUF4157 domain-containing protein [Coleofasciculus sp. C1-SOL-03]|uniref:eCIS core domain-containing protein n=1 Tax=Coleofasciculus sp. C1-SOL-03 TaxID=3069522 RepID=UPI0033018040